MKIRYLIVFVLVIVLCFSSYLLINLRNKNLALKEQYINLEEIINQNEIDKESYLNKEKQLEELKEKKKDKVLRYEEVEKWNKEIIEYLN